MPQAPQILSPPQQHPIHPVHQVHAVHLGLVGVARSLVSRQVAAAGKAALEFRVEQMLELSKCQAKPSLMDRLLHLTLSE